jgi:PAS domain S-box-containing protein
VPSITDDPYPRRALIGAGAMAIVLVAAMAWHDIDLRASTLAATQRRFDNVAASAARMVDSWVAERNSDVSALAEVLATERSDADARLRMQMEAIQRRAHYDGVWIVDSAGHILAESGGRSLTALENDALRSAAASRSLVVSRPEQRGNLITVAVARAIADRADSTRIRSIIVFRADLESVFAQRIGSAVRNSATTLPVLVVPTSGTPIGLSFCPAPAVTLCIVPTVDSIARLAQSKPEWFGRLKTATGQKLVFATRRVTTLPWSVYYAADEGVQLAPMRERLRFETLLLLGVLLVAGLGVYAYDRAAKLRHHLERTQTDARFAAIVNTAMDAIIIVDESFAITVVNTAAELMFDHRGADMIGTSVLDLVPAASVDELRQALNRTLQGAGQPRLFSADRYAAGKRRDGSTFPVDLSISRSEAGGRASLTIVIRDVSDWKRAEEGSEWQRRVLESIATGAELRDVLTSIARFLEAQCPGVSCAIHLLDDHEVTLLSACAPTMPAAFVDAMDEIVVGPQAATCGTAVFRGEPVLSIDIATDPLWNDYRALAAEHGYRACWARPIRSPHGDILGALATYAREPRGPSECELRVIGTATQLAGIAADSANAAESLRQSEASFRSFVENSPIGIYRATGSGRLIAVNASLVQLLGYESASELLRLDMTREVFASAADRDRVFKELETQGEARSAEVAWRRKDGTTVTVRVSARAYRDERGALWFSEGFVENITPLRIAEQAVRQSEKLAALGQLVSGVAHELNNPLAAILHFAEDLLDDERTAADLEALSVIRDQARRSRTIVRDLLSFVRFRDAARDRVQLAAALTTTVKALQPTVEEIGGRLTSELPEAAVFGNTDPAGLQQIVTNLVINAAQASGKGGHVHLRATVADCELTIVVDDTGPGIPATDMGRIFEPFFTTKPLGQGTGLGLSVTLGVVQQLGGRIAVENRGPSEGSGARFTVTLPIGGGPVAVPGRLTPRFTSVQSRPSATTDGATSPRVLIIDDEPSIRAALRRFFMRRGWRVDEASDGAQGLEILLGARGDLAVVISDLKMPGFSGVELHDRVAEVAPELLDRIIFSTGDVASKDAAAFVQRTKCTVLQKPFELRAIEELVARLREPTAV